MPDVVLGHLGERMGGLRLLATPGIERIGAASEQRPGLGMQPPRDLPYGFRDFSRLILPATARLDTPSTCPISAKLRPLRCNARNFAVRSACHVG